jgi:hypothetical protein
MIEMPPAEFHADAIDIHFTADKKNASLLLINQIQTFTVLIPTIALDQFIARVQKLKDEPDKPI